MKYTGEVQDPTIEDSGDAPPGWNYELIQHYVRDIGGNELAIYNDSTVVFWNVYGLDNVGRINYSDNSWNFYLKDHLGTPRVVIDGNGEIISAEDLDMWGYRMTDRSFQSDTIFYKYTGKERDVTTGYDYFGARYYVSRIGNWTSIDPLFEKHYDFSPYNYVLRNPLNLIDPDGRRVADDDPERAAPAFPLPTIPLPVIGGVAVGGAYAVAVIAGIYLGHEVSAIIFESPVPSTSVFPIADPIGFIMSLPTITIKIGEEGGMPIYQLLPDQYVIGTPSHVGLIPPYEISKGGDRNVWPSRYPKPGLDKIDWSKGDDRLADEITGPGIPKGPGSEHNAVKKWFQRHRPKAGKKK